ncbi:MAG: succinyl-diaminopimelate desuccinylase [OM182 bacterium MED-G24]|uniref:Succinyl-diaminopimelate desuccinylase n=1 Tax=OM182 bacterium MED-G24 TaxID=1986255 RepID=A0A2A5WYY0_9GAMM|nr:MAG: succinyl-diaminopimelate desuccinylase [OM182 bacterium MED-G24]
MPTTEPSSRDRTLALTCDLIRRPSVSPEDRGCQQQMGEILEKLGFTVQHMRFHDVDNLWATLGDQGPIFAFAGHTDVVPPGSIDEWSTDPFTPEVRDNNLFGRGAADMKGALAAMLTATEQFLDDDRQPKGTLAFLITSDEEADAVNGTVKVIDALVESGTHIDYCVVGEPSSSEVLGDVIRVGRRGSLSGTLTIHGIQGHVAYPTDARNPIHEAAPALAELVATGWDDGNDFFPGTTCQISNINGGTGANNVIPGELTVLFNFRFSPESSEESLRSQTEEILNRHGLHYDLRWRLSGHPFLTTGGTLIPAVVESIRAVTGVETELSTSGGTSDGRFIAPTGTEVVELGVCNATIHKVNEQVSVAELGQLTRVYHDILERILG